MHMAAKTCVSVCPFDAIKIKDDGKAFINEYCQMLVWHV